MVYPLNIKAFLESACSHLNPPRNPSNRRLLHLHQIQSTSEMESATPSKRAKTAAGVATPQKMGKAAALADQFLTPEKPTPKVAAAAEQIWTPEKPEQPSAAERRARSSGGVAFSVKGVRRAALELRRRSERGAASPAAAAEDELEAVERQLGVGPAPVRSPVKRRAKLPER